MRVFLVAFLMAVMKINMSFAGVSEKVDYYVEKLSVCDTFGILARVSSSYVETEYGCLDTEKNQIDRYKFQLEDFEVNFQNEHQVFKMLREHFLLEANEDRFVVSKSEYSSPHAAVEKFAFSRNKFRHFTGRQKAK